MNKALLVCLFCVLAVALAAGLRSTSLESYNFDAFTRDFPTRDYMEANGCPHELARRKSIVQANIDMINAHNARYKAGKESWYMDVNNFLDLTEAEITAKFTGLDKEQTHRKNALLGSAFGNAKSLASKKALPTSVNWEEKGAMGAVKNQGGCGSCWAFATTTTMEAHYFLASGEKSTLSPQQLTSCAPNPHKCGGNGGCEGATFQIATDYLTSVEGFVSEKDYPYTSGGGSTGSCKYSPSTMKPVMKVAGHKDLPFNNKDALMEALANVGPVSVSIAASRLSFYSGGIFRCNGDYEINHAVVMFGYGEEVVNGKTQYYFNIRNSWGSGWGEKGNFRLYRSAPEVDEACGIDKKPYDGSACADDSTPRVEACGECGILYDSSYPIGVEKY